MWLASWGLVTLRGLASRRPSKTQRNQRLTQGNRRFGVARTVYPGQVRSQCSAPLRVLAPIALLRNGLQMSETPSTLPEGKAAQCDECRMDRPGRMASPIPPSSTEVFLVIGRFAHR
ncbi:hypothetical protein CSOJ01_05826 [Colletotrichum sojae]|uniref:Uncharacterized protein n=1 Tax=Colletotrichum sojae TaxID=2175907 RepID=A0A8H6JEL6_9PEZI|nr:hypothetical protein CSOJ01_05826 [Colletotrichum sojae]